MIEISDILKIAKGIVTVIVVESIIEAFLPAILTLITPVQKYFPLIYLIPILNLIPILIILTVIIHELKFG
ncbi:MAG: hypothetical protein ACP5IB_06855 [Thermoplasmata archaeon]